MRSNHDGIRLISSVRQAQNDSKRMFGGVTKRDHLVAHRRIDLIQDDPEPAQVSMPRVNASPRVDQPLSHSVRVE